MHVSSGTKLRRKGEDENEKGKGSLLKQGVGIKEDRIKTAVFTVYFCVFN